MKSKKINFPELEYAFTISWSMIKNVDAAAIPNTKYPLIQAKIVFIVTDLSLSTFLIILVNSPKKNISVNSDCITANIP
jgi:hypothetical protein